MTLKQLFKIFMKVPMFDCNRAICVLLQGQNQILVPSEYAKARKTWKISEESFRIDQGEVHGPGYPDFSPTMRPAP